MHNEPGGEDIIAIINLHKVSGIELAYLNEDNYSINGEVRENYNNIPVIEAHFIRKEMHFNADLHRKVFQLMNN
jgi:hypothetical protein